MTPSTALRLAKYFGNSPDFWLLLQHRWDLYKAMKAEAQELKRIQPVQELLKDRAQRGSRKKFDRALKKIRDVEPDSGD